MFCLTGICRFSGLIFVYFFVRNGVSKEGNFSGAGCKHMSKGEILLDRVIILSNFVLWSTFFTAFF